MVTEVDSVFPDIGKKIWRLFMKCSEMGWILLCLSAPLEEGWEITDDSGIVPKEEEGTDMSGADHHLWHQGREEGETDRSGADHHLWHQGREEEGTDRSGADHHLWRQSSVHHVDRSFLFSCLTDLSIILWWLAHLFSCSTRSKPQSRPRSTAAKTRAGSPAHPVNCSSFCSGTAVLLITSILMTCPGAGAVCVGREVDVDRGEAVLRCPLTADVRRTMHNIIIKHFTDSTSFPETVLQCLWNELNKIDCNSKFDFKLVKLETCSVMAKVPKTKLRKDGSYKCQLDPPDEDQPFTQCEIFHSDDPEDPPTTDRPVSSSPTADLSESVPGASEKTLTGSDGVPENGSHLEGLVVAVVVLAFTVIILLLLDIGVILFYFKTRGRARPQREENTLLNGTS